MIETHLPKADGDGVYTKYLTSPQILSQSTIPTPEAPAATLHLELTLGWED